MTNRGYAAKESVRVALKDQIQEFLVAHPASSNADVVKVFRCSPATVTKARRDAVKSGLVGPSYFDHRTLEGREAYEAGETPGDNLEDRIKDAVLRVKPGKQLTTEESLDMLSELARAAQRDGANKLAIEANLAFHRLKSQSKEAILGPGPPLTFEDKIERTSRVLECVGIRITKAAIAVAFPRGRFDLPEDDVPEIYVETIGDPNADQIQESQ